MLFLNLTTAGFSAGITARKQSLETVDFFLIILMISKMSLKVILIRKTSSNW